MPGLVKLIHHQFCKGGHPGDWILLRKQISEILDVKGKDKEEEETSKGRLTSGHECLPAAKQLE